MPHCSIELMIGILSQNHGFLQFLAKNIIAAAGKMSSKSHKARSKFVCPADSSVPRAASS